jgi:hypothetical protein
MRRFNHVKVVDEAEIAIEFSYKPGCAPSGPSWYSGGDPGWPAETDIETFTITFGGPKLSLVLHPSDLTPDARQRMAAYLNEKFYTDMTAEVEDALEEV